MSQMKNNAVNVLFLRPIPTDPILNRLTGLVGALTHGEKMGACHVEMCLPHQDGYMTSSIYNGETVNVTMSKTFSNPGYNVHTLMVSDHQLSDMKKFIFQTHGRKDTFDGVGMYLACLPVQLPRFSRHHTTFCSKYITEILQTGNIPEVCNLNANITTPSRLLCKLTPATKNTLGTVSHKLRSLEKSAVFHYTSIPSDAFSL